MIVLSRATCCTTESDQEVLPLKYANIDIFLKLAQLDSVASNELCCYSVTIPPPKVYEHGFIMKLFLAKATSRPLKLVYF